MINSRGILRYSPPLLGGRDEKWWLVLDCDLEIVKYYRHLYKMNSYFCEEMIKPAWDSHITVIRNEEPQNKIHWNKYNGLPIDFTYSHIVENDGNYWWLPVQSLILEEIRLELGLSKDPEFPFHLSVGHQGKRQ